MDRSTERLSSVLLCNPNVTDGKRELLALLKDQFPAYDFPMIEEFDMYTLQSEFQSWFGSVLRNEPHPKGIRAVWFGFFDAVYDKDETLELYIMGSTITPEEDRSDWSCVDRDSYWPDGRYAHIETLYQLYDLLKTLTTDSSEFIDLLNLVFPALIYLLLLNADNEIKEILLDGRDELYIGCGYDDAGMYLYGRLTSDRLTDWKVQEY